MSLIASIKCWPVRFIGWVTALTLSVMKGIILMTEPRLCDCPECGALDRKHPREGKQPRCNPCQRETAMSDAALQTRTNYPT